MCYLCPTRNALLVALCTVVWVLDFAFYRCCCVPTTLASEPRSYPLHLYLETHLCSVIPNGGQWSREHRHGYYLPPPPLSGRCSSKKRTEPRVKPLLQVNLGPCLASSNLILPKIRGRTLKVEGSLLRRPRACLSARKAGTAGSESRVESAVTKY